MDVSADGNCLYRSIAILKDGDERLWDAVRQAHLDDVALNIQGMNISQLLFCNNVDFQQSTLPECGETSFAAFKERHRKDGVFGDFANLLLLSAVCA
jgi:hypothetical protein